MCGVVWPFSDIHLEKEPPKPKKEHTGMEWKLDANTNTWILVPTQQFPTVIPMVYQSQPQYYVQSNQLAYAGQPGYVAQYPFQQYIQPAGYHIQQPAFGTVGLTPSEVLQQQITTAENTGVNAKQEMKPADDDPLRVYWVRELDNTWTQRNRVTIDSGDIGECRWYSIDGLFYAVRLASG